MIGYSPVRSLASALSRCLRLVIENGREHTAASAANQRPVNEWPGVFVTEYERPYENILMCPSRDANPFFHYLEAMWILAGRNDVAFLKRLLPRIADYSDDGISFHGAYGYRLRHAFGFDQIEKAVRILRAKPDTRQVVLSIWDPIRDLGAESKDIPCNDMVLLKIRDGKLNLTVCNRSNDIVWGAYGANAVQFSILQQYLAAQIGVGVGVYTQVSDSMHAYLDNPFYQKFAESMAEHEEPHTVPGTPQYELYHEHVATGVVNWKNPFDGALDDAEIAGFFECIDNGFLPNPNTFRSTAVHDAAVMYDMYVNRNGDRVSREPIFQPLWAQACAEWLYRRAAK